MGRSVGERTVAAGLAALLLVASCSDDDGGGTGAAAGADTTAPPATAGAAQAVAGGGGARVPGDDWEVVDPAEAGFDPAALDALAAQAEAAGSTCLVVTRDGAVVDERTFGGADPDATREAFSATKSITSVLVGIAADQGLLDLDAPAAEHIAEWRGTPSEAVTVRNLVSNDSGRHWDLATDYSEMALAAVDKTAFAVALDQAVAPGEVWAYNNSAIQTLEAVLESAVGGDVGAWAEEVLFDPIGMDDTTLATDGAGNALMFMGAQTTCHDLARFGLLALRGGEWDGEQVVSAEYLAAATGAPSTPLNAAYGYLWWINHEGPIGDPTVATGGPDAADDAGDAGDGAGGAGGAEGRLVPGAPPDAFWALGLFGQIVAVVPSEGIVAVRMGAEPPPEAPFSQAQLTEGVLAARTDPNG